MRKFYDTKPMSVAELLQILEQVLVEGLDPDTSVFLDVRHVDPDDSWVAVGKVHNPAADKNYIWLTIDTAGSFRQYESVRRGTLTVELADSFEDPF